MSHAALMIGLGVLAGLGVVGCGPLYTALAERRYPPLGRQVHLDDDLTAHVVERGRGRPVLFVHGALTTLHDFALSPLWEGEADGWRYLAVDRPGRGYSRRPAGAAMTVVDEAAFVQRVIEIESLDRPIIVGHSAGAAVALAHALEHPDAAAGYVLLGPAAFLPEGDTPAPVGLLRWMTLPVIGPVLSETVFPPLAGVLTPALVRRSFAPNPVAEPFRRLNGALVRRPGQFRHEARDLLTFADTLEQLAPRYGQVRQPVVIVAGEADRLAAFDQQARRLHTALPRSELVRLEGVGHMVHVVRPGAVREAIARVAALADGEADGKADPRIPPGDANTNRVDADDPVTGP